MKRGNQSLQDLATELQRQLGTQQDYIASTVRLGFTAENGVATLAVDQPGEELVELPINAVANDQIAGHLGIPTKFYDRLLAKHPDILQDTVSKLFAREPSVRMIRTLDGKARAFLSDRYRRLDHYDLLEHAVLPALAGTEGRIFSSALTDSKLYVQIVFQDIEVDLGPGRGPVSPGLTISNSEVGLGALSIEPFSFTHLCENGTIFSKQLAEYGGIRKTHLGRRVEDTALAREVFTQRTLDLDDKALFAVIYDTIKAAVGGISWLRISERLQEVAGIAVPGNPVAVVEKLAKANSFSEDEFGSIMQHLIQGGDLTQYGYSAAVTRAAQDVESYDRAIELERIGGNLIEGPAQTFSLVAA